MGTKAKRVTAVLNPVAWGSQTALLFVLGARKGLQARAQLMNQGSGGQGPGRNSGYRANSLQLLSQHRIPRYTWGGPARSLSIPSSYFASFFSRPSTPYSCPTSYLPKAMNLNNTMLLLRGVTGHPSPLLPRSLAPWSEESAGKSGAPCADRHRGPTRAESNQPIHRVRPQRLPPVLWDTAKLPAASKGS